MDETTAPARAPFVHAVVLDGEAVLLDERENRLHLLNHTATLLWQLYDGATTLDALAEEISDELGLERGAVLLDLVAVSQHLADEGLLAGYERVDRDEPA
jgi:hypothetical protein